MSQVTVRAFREVPSEEFSTGYLGEWVLPAYPAVGELVQSPEGQWYRVAQRILYAMDAKTGRFRVPLVFFQPAAEPGRSDAALDSERRGGE